jgi:hypothetical protein
MKYGVSPIDKFGFFYANAIGFVSCATRISRQILLFSNIKR